MVCTKVHKNVMLVSAMFTDNKLYACAPVGISALEVFK